MYKYIIKKVTQEVENETEIRRSILRKKMRNSQKIAMIENYKGIKNDLMEHRVTEAIFGGCLVITTCLCAYLIKISPLRLLSVGLSTFMIGGLTVLNLQELQSIRKTKQKLQSAKRPKETMEELEEKKENIEKELEVSKKNLKNSLMTLKYMKFMEEIQNDPIILADNQEEFQKMTEDIHKECGKKLTKVQK